MDLFVISNNNVKLACKLLKKERFHGKFDKDRCNFSINPQKNMHVRYIMEGLSLNYEMNHYTNELTKNLLLSRGDVSMSQINLALSCYDIEYLTTFSAFLKNFNFSGDPFEEEARKDLKRVIGKRDLEIKWNHRKDLTVKQINLKLLILDDIFDSNVPIFDANLQISRLHNYTTHQYRGISNFTISLDLKYFNCQIRQWEPMLENFSFEIQK